MLVFHLSCKLLQTLSLQENNLGGFFRIDGVDETGESRLVADVGLPASHIPSSHTNR